MKSTTKHGLDLESQVNLDDNLRLALIMRGVIEQKVGDHTGIKRAQKIQFINFIYLL